jgi:hypothetical protein
MLLRGRSDGAVIDWPSESCRGEQMFDDRYFGEHVCRNRVMKDSINQGEVCGGKAVLAYVERCVLFPFGLPCAHSL